MLGIVERSGEQLLVLIDNLLTMSRMEAVPPALIGSDSESLPGLLRRMDAERLRNPGTAEEFREAVLAVRRALDFGSGGVIAQCQWDSDVRLQTIAAFFEQWLLPLPMHA